MGEQSNNSQIENENEISRERKEDDEDMGNDTNSDIEIMENNESPQGLNTLTEDMISGTSSTWKICEIKKKHGLNDADILNKVATIIDIVAVEFNVALFTILKVGPNAEECINDLFE